MADKNNKTGPVLDYAQPLPLLKQKRVQRWIILAIVLPVIVYSVWSGWHRFVEYRRQRQLALDRATVTAAETGDMVKLVSVLDQGGGLNSRNVWGRTPLLIAVQRQDRPMVELLLRRGADPNAADGGGNTPLLMAVGKDDLDLAKLLASKGALVTKPVGRDDLLYYAIKYGNTRFVQWLIQQKADVDFAGQYGFRPLHCAVMFQQRPALDLLLAAGAKPDATCDDGETPLSFACWRNERGMAEALIAHGAQPTFQSAVAFGDLAKVKHYLETDRTLLIATNKEGKGIGFLAARNGQQEVFVYLVQQGMPIDQADRHGVTLLHEAANGGNCGIIEFLLGKGMNVNVKDHSGETPLHCTTWNGRVQAAKLLIERGADIEAKTDSNITPMVWAISYRQPKLVDLLLSKGAKLPPDSLHHAVVYADLGMIRFLVERGANVNGRDSRGRTALHVATGWGKKDMIEFLISHGADTTLRDNKGRQPADVKDAEPTSN